MVADGSEPEFARHVLGLFAQSAPELLAGIESAARGRDTKSLLRTVHTLKSSSASVGAMALSEQAREMENRLRAGAEPEPDWPAVLREHYAQFESAVAQYAGVTLVHAA
jgi:HPt (histidine-containing phosphotransfer) domain-containing protein